jgi:hypothetical protein
MSAGMWFWIVLVVSCLLGGFFLWPFERRSGVWLVVVVLFALLGYHVFGPPVR